jgi:hypothetical protein
MTGHPKHPRDPNQLARSIIDIATGEKPDREAGFWRRRAPVKN